MYVYTGYRTKSLNPSGAVDSDTRIKFRLVTVVKQCDPSEVSGRWVIVCEVLESNRDQYNVRYRDICLQPSLVGTVYQIGRPGRGEGVTPVSSCLSVWDIRAGLECYHSDDVLIALSVVAVIRPW